ncbi:acetylornithine deacetylase [Terrihabitans soli]|uniref:Acetylornithine deacetylase n=1 Tax=Terrihabitans soli TaxID=708113 RepID=A0A6S6QHK1_9HYPH|nr:acetylornithine deacetylase [Terrihabitans soli]BCJ90653.1 acetylornithine deacetylase [Terrihabitans soli]
MEGLPAPSILGTGGDATGANVARAVDILSRLIEFKTVCGGPNLDAVSYIAAYLAQYGVTSKIIHDPSGTKASILASIGPVGRPGVVLSAHTDVVPADDQNWSTPPFTASRRDGRVFGRGATDMKGFVALVLAHLPSFCAAKLTAPIHIAFSYDEELGCKGAPDLVAAVAALPAKPVLCIIGEPTKMRVVRGHKGKVARRITISGRGGHSAYPDRGANAVYAAAQIATGLRALGQESALREEAPGFDPRYATVHVGSLHGGTALNLVPEKAVLEFEIRFTPKTDIKALLRRVDLIVETALAPLQAVAPEAYAQMENMIDYPGLDIPAQSPATSIVQTLSGSKETPSTISFGTEAGLYAAAGIPSLVCGPGDIARAHIADEWIGTDELADASRMFDRLTALLSRPGWDALLQYQEAR